MNATDLKDASHISEVDTKRFASHSDGNHPKVDRLIVELYRLPGEEARFILGMM